MKSMLKKAVISALVFALCAFCFVGCGDDDGKKKPGGDGYEHVKGEELTQDERAGALGAFYKYKNYTDTSNVKMWSDYSSGGGYHDEYVATYKYDCENNVIEINVKGNWENVDIEQRMFYIYEDNTRYEVLFDKSGDKKWTVRADDRQLTPFDVSLDGGPAGRLLPREIQTLQNDAGSDFAFNADKGVYALSKQETEEVQKIHSVDGAVTVVKGSDDYARVAELKFKDKRLVGVLYGANNYCTYEDDSWFKKEWLSTSVITDVGTTTITVPTEVRAALDAYKAQNPSGEA